MFPRSSWKSLARRGNAQHQDWKQDKLRVFRLQPSLPALLLYLSLTSAFVRLRIRTSVSILLYRGSALNQTWFIVRSISLSKFLQRDSTSEWCSFLPENGITNSNYFATVYRANGGKLLPSEASFVCFKRVYSITIAP